MIGTRILALAGRIVRGFRHDPRTLALIVVVPLVVMMLIGYLLTGTKAALPVGITGSSAERFAGELRDAPGIVVERVSSVEEGRSMVLDGDLVALVIIEPTGPSLAIAGVDPRLEEPAVTSIVTALEGSAGVTAPTIPISTIGLPAGVRLATIDVFAPAIIALFAFFFIMMLTSVAFLRERSSGTLDRLLASPITTTEILLGYLLGFMGFATVQALLVLGYATFVLHVTISGSIWLVLLALALLVVGAVNLGITLSFYARNELQVIQFIPLVLLPQIFLGGLFWPVQTLWVPLRWLSQLFPLTHAAAALRGVMIAGYGIGEVAVRLLALLAFAFAMVALGVIVLRRQRA